MTTPPTLACPDESTLVLLANMKLCGPQLRETRLHLEDCAFCANVYDGIEDEINPPVPVDPVFMKAFLDKVAPLPSAHLTYDAEDVTTEAQCVVRFTPELLTVPQLQRVRKHLHECAHCTELCNQLEAALALEGFQWPSEDEQVRLRAYVFKVAPMEGEVQ